MTFWRLSFFNSKYLLAPSKAGLISNPAPANSTSTVGGGDSPSYSGFFHCLAVFDDRSSPCFNLEQPVYCRVYGIPFFHGFFYPVLLWFIPCNLPSPTCVTTCLPTILKLSQAYFMLESTRYFILNTDQIPFYSIKLITLMFYFLDPLLFIYLSILRSPASGMLPTEQQYNGYSVITPFISSTHQCLSLLLAFNTLFLSRFPFVFPCLWTQYTCNEGI